MSLDSVLPTIDAEIARLQQARAASAPTATSAPKKVRRTMSAEARKRIAEAQRKRWAAQEKVTSKTA